MKKFKIMALVLVFGFNAGLLSLYADEKSMHRDASESGAHQGYRSSRWAEYNGDRFSYFLNRGFEAHMHDDLDKAIELYSVAAKYKRNNQYLAFSNRAQIYYSRCEYDLAIEDYSKVLELKPNQFQAYISRGNVWLAKKEPFKAAEDFSQAIYVNPECGPAYISRGRLFASIGKQAEAFQDFTKALELDKETPNPLIAMAWFLATCPEDKYRNGSRAVELAQNAIQRTHNWQGMVKKRTSTEVMTYQQLPLAPQYDVLAAAYAEYGNFTEATAAEQKAISLLQYENLGHHLPEFSQRLKFYEEMKPWRAVANYQ